MLDAIREIALTLAGVIFFVVIMPVLAAGGFFLMMHGVNEHSDTIATIGLVCIPAGWIALAYAFRLDF